MEERTWFNDDPERSSILNSTFWIGVDEVPEAKKVRNRVKRAKKRVNFMMPRARVEF